MVVSMRTVAGSTDDATEDDDEVAAGTESQDDETAGDDPDVLGEFVTNGNDGDAGGSDEVAAAAAEREAGGSALPFTGAALWTFVAIATGLLMVNEACTAEQGQGLLRSAAATDEKTIVEIAQRIIDQHQRSR